MNRCDSVRLVLQNCSFVYGWCSYDRLNGYPPLSFLVFFVPIKIRVRNNAHPYKNCILIQMVTLSRNRQYVTAEGRQDPCHEHHCGQHKETHLLHSVYNNRRGLTGRLDNIGLFHQQEVIIQRDG